MKQPPYFKLTEAESQTAIWAGLMFMLITATMIALVSQRLTDASQLRSAGAQINSTVRRELLDGLQQTFATERQRGEIVVAEANAHLHLIINAQLLFAPREMELSLAGRNILNRLAQTLRSSTSTRYQEIQIEGHTERDDFAAAYYPRDNWELSSARAVSALKYLAEATRFEARLFSAHSYADARHLPAAQSGPRKLRNGRLEILIGF
jgi:flagellar motor protein MotB